MDMGNDRPGRLLFLIPRFVILSGWFSYRFRCVLGLGNYGSYGVADPTGKSI